MLRRVWHHIRTIFRRLSSQCGYFSESSGRSTHLFTGCFAFRLFFNPGEPNLWLWFSSWPFSSRYGNEAFNCI
jgi:hypothetical protein